MMLAISQPANTGFSAPFGPADLSFGKWTRLMANGLRTANLFA
jgi:hypothetical protein